MILEKDLCLMAFATNIKFQVFANKDGKLSEFQADITNLVYAIEIIQLFSGADDWNVVITVTNTENGVEIAKANCPKEELIIVNCPLCQGHFELV